ncbi:hypothetical protein ACF0H5_022592 [Mactra antiquata]
MGTGLTVSFETNTSLEKRLLEAMSLKQNTSFCSRIVQYFSVAMVSLTLYYLLNGKTDTEVTDKTNVIFLHLLSLATHVGTQCWVTFIAGFTMFFNLPRILFGRLQSTLFPVYFGTSLTLACVTLLTYVKANGYEHTSQTYTYQFSLLLISIVCPFINSLILAPQIVDTMIKVFDLEKDSGVAYNIGYCDRTELKKNPTYAQYYKQFRRVHGVSGIMNVTTLVSNILYIYSVSSIVVIMDVA